MLLPDGTGQLGPPSNGAPAVTWGPSALAVGSSQWEVTWVSPF